MDKINKDKVVKWVKLFSITGITQILIQIFGLLSGIVIIRLMSVEEYAWYTIANTILGTLTLLSDAGISTGVLSEGGKVWNNKELLGKVMVTGMRLRTRFASISLFICIPILIVLLHRQNASPLQIVLICLSIIPSFLASLTDILLEIPIKLYQDVLALQKNQLFTSILRLLLISFSIFIFPFTYIALLGNGIPRLWANRNLKKINKQFFDNNQIPDKNVESSILKLVSKILPGSLFYCIYGQITIWIITLLGKSASIAQIGAFGRLSMVLSLINVIISILIIPRFSKIISPYFLKKRTMQIQIGLLILMTIIIIISYLLSNYLLLILGNKYKGLNYELFLSIISSCIGIVGGATYNLFTSKGWAIKPYIQIPMSLLSLLIGLIIFNCQTLVGILFLSIFTGFIQYIFSLFFLFYKIGYTKFRVKN